MDDHETRTIPPSGPRPAEKLTDLWQQASSPDLHIFLAGQEALSPRDLLDVLLVDQRQRWARGERPLVEDYLQAFPDLEKAGDLVLDLLYGEYLLRERHGDKSSLEDLAARFPRWAEAFRQQVEIDRALSPSVTADSEATVDGETATRVGGTAWQPEVPGYEILEKIGRGGMGVVYKARHLRLNRLVALKMLLAGHDAHAEEHQRFHTEAEAAARLQHPNIVQIFEVGEHAGLPYLAMEYVAGGSLAEQLRAGPQPAKTTAELIETLARAVHYAHLQGVIHRDLKPSNILLGGKSEVGSRDESAEELAYKFPVPHSALNSKIADFGLAKLLESDARQTQTGALLGTPTYMAPEQAGKSKEVGPRADVYALGVILYEMLTGRPPFQGDSVQETIRQVLENEPVPPSRLLPRLSRDLETICLKCLEKEPGKRYGSALDLAEDLRRFRAGEPIKARPVGRWERGWRWCRRNQSVAASLAAVIFTLILGASVATWLAILAHASSERALKLAEEKGKLANSNARLAEEKSNLAEETQRTLKLEEKARTRAEWLAYSGQIGQAQSAWREGNAAVAWDRLESCQGNLRGWEHNYLVTLFNKNQRTIRGHTNAVVSVAFSPDGKRIVSGSSDQTLKVWDAASGQETLTLKGHTIGVMSVAFSPDGKRVVSGGGGEFNKPGELKVWDAASGQETLTLKGHTDAVTSVVFSPDGKRLVSGSYDQTLKVWEAATGQETLTLKGHTHMVMSVAFSPDGKRIVSGGGEFSKPGELKVWDAASGQETLTFKGHVSYVESGAFSPDGKRLVSGSVDRTLKVWDAASGQETLTLKGHADVVASVAFSPDGKRIVSASQDGTLKMWDAATGQKNLTLKGHINVVASVAFSPDGKRLVSGSGDRTLKVWDAANGQETLTLNGHKEMVTSVAFSPDGKRIVSGSWDQTLKVWDAVTGQEILTLKGHNNVVASVAFSPDGKRIVSGSGDQTLKVWGASTPQERPNSK